MPQYVYECRPNHHRFEVWQGFHDDPVTVCPECGGEVRRVILPVGIVFKGAGFYATDSKKATSAPAATTGSTSDSTGKADSKTNNKSEKAAESGSKAESTSKPASESKND